MTGTLCLVFSCCALRCHSPSPGVGDGGDGADGEEDKGGGFGDRYCEQSSNSGASLLRRSVERRVVENQPALRKLPICAVERRQHLEPCTVRADFEDRAVVICTPVCGAAIQRRANERKSTEGILTVSTSEAVQEPKSGAININSEEYAVIVTPTA